MQRRVIPHVHQAQYAGAGRAARVVDKPEPHPPPLDSRRRALCRPGGRAGTTSSRSAMKGEEVGVVKLVPGLAGKMEWMWSMLLTHPGPDGRPHGDAARGGHGDGGVLARLPDVVRAQRVR